MVCGFLENWGIEVKGQGDRFVVPVAWGQSGDKRTGLFWGTKGQVTSPRCN
jgi:hypothetical protein